MKRVNLFVLIFTLTLIVQGQNLSNTYWEVKFGGSIERIANFYQDTLYFSHDNGVTFIAASTYTVNGNLFNLLDLPQTPANCGSDTGFYSFSVIGDTLNFNTISDICGGRNSFFVFRDWVKYLNTNLKDNYGLVKGLTFYPNPVADFLNIANFQNNIKSEYQIYDSFGKLVIEGRIESQEIFMVDLTELKKGIYFFKQLNSKYEVQKIIKL